MEHSTENDVSEERQERESTVGRRQLLKAIIAAGGTVAASALLSSRWVRPIIKVGQLPAHAQGSYDPTPSATQSATPTYYSLCYTPTPSPTRASPTPTSRPFPTPYTSTPPPPTDQLPPPTQESRRALLERLLAEERFPPDVTRELG